jgi:hypothetical protein
MLSSRVSRPANGHPQRSVQYGYDMVKAIIHKCECEAAGDVVKKADKLTGGGAQYRRPPFPHGRSWLVTRDSVTPWLVTQLHKLMCRSMQNPNASVGQLHCNLHITTLYCIKKWHLHDIGKPRTQTNVHVWCLTPGTLHSHPAADVTVSDYAKSSNIQDMHIPTRKHTAHAYSKSTKQTHTAKAHSKCIQLTHTAKAHSARSVYIVYTWWNECIDMGTLTKNKGRVDECMDVHDCTWSTMDHQSGDVSRWSDDGRK